MPHRPRPTSRRAVLGAGLGVGAATLAGCAESLDPTPADPTITPTSGPSTVTPTAPTPSGSLPSGEPTEDADLATTDDEALVADVLTALALAHRTARANARVHPEQAGALRAFERLHARHGADLGDLPATRGRVADPAEDAAAVLARIDRSERRLEDALVEAAVAARSGALAQTFASMAAATAQLRSLLAGVDR